MQRQWRLASRPEGIPDRSHFDLVEVPIPAIEPGKAVVKTLYLGVAPVMLRYMRNETDFESPIALGSVMAGRGVAQVIESDCIDLPVGAIVQARVGWQEYALIDTSQRPAPFELQTEAEMLRLLIYKTAAQMDQMDKVDVAKKLTDKVSMCNYRANRLVCNAADTAMQFHGGLGYSRHKPFEHIYRHHRRYRITEGAEEIQLRKIAGVLYGFVS